LTPSVRPYSFRALLMDCDSRHDLRPATSGVLARSARHCQRVVHRDGRTRLANLRQSSHGHSQVGVHRHTRTPASRVDVGYPENDRNLAKSSTTDLFAASALRGRSRSSPQGLPVSVLPKRAKNDSSQIGGENHRWRVHPCPSREQVAEVSRGVPTPGLAVGFAGRRSRESSSRIGRHERRMLKTPGAQNRHDSSHGSLDYRIQRGNGHIDGRSADTETR